MMGSMIFAGDPVAAPNPTPPPVAAFTPDGAFEDNYTFIQLLDLSEGLVTAWEWKINGVLFAVTKNTGYYFTVPGTYVIELTVSNPYGSDSVSYNFDIR